MQYQKLGSTDIEVSKVCFGTWGLGGGSVWADETMNVNTVRNLLSAAKDAGINYIDTAPVYGTGESERLLGEALKGRRDDFILQTKCSLNWRGEGNFHYERDGFTVCNDTSALSVRRDVEDSLTRLQTDHIDVLVVHYVCRDWPAEETMGELMKLVQEGKIRAVGLSNSEPEDLEEYSRYGSVALVQEQFSLLAPSHGRSYFPMCAKHHTSFQVYGALEEGFLASADKLDRVYAEGDIRARLPWQKEPYISGLRHLFEVMKPLCEMYDCTCAQLIEAWTVKQYDNLSLLVGLRHEKTIQSTADCFRVHLSDEDARILEEAVKPIQVESLDK